MTETNPPAFDQAWSKQLALLCKRGNRETELLLEAYLPRLRLLDAAYQQRFAQLLQHPDPSLLSWLLNPDTDQSIPQELCDLIHDIRTHFLQTFHSHCSPMRHRIPPHFKDPASPYQNE
jgi:succinate dehydrogenase flavin-adding protein (antitoxin of CptAB toxin-antitoxin module)